MLLFIVLGLCTEHNDPLNCIQYIWNQKDADIIIDYVNDNDFEWHLATMVNVIQVHIVTKDKVRIFLLASLPHCGLKADEYHAKWIGILSRTTISQFILLSFSSDGATAWRKAKRYLLGKSTDEINTGLHMVPKRAVGSCAYTSDQRHNIKGTFAAASRKSVKVISASLNVQIIHTQLKKFNIEKDEKITASRMQSVVLGYKSDPMNVVNALLYHQLVDKLRIRLEIKLKEPAFSQLQSPSQMKIFRGIIIYARINYAYVSTLFNRSANWNTLLKNFAIAACGNWILFNEHGTKSMSWENFHEKQISTGNPV
eukprot:361567_1